MNNRTSAYIRKAVENVTLAQVHDYCDLTDEEQDRLNEIANELLALITPKFIVTLEGWWWDGDERRYAHIDDLHSFPCESAAVDECDELADEQEKLLLAATSADFYDGTALVVYERRGSESRAVQMYILQYGRTKEHYWGDECDHVAL